MSDDRFDKPEHATLASETFRMWFERMCAYHHTVVNEDAYAVYLQSLGRVPLHELDETYLRLVERGTIPITRIPVVKEIRDEIARRAARTPTPAPPADEDSAARYQRLLLPLLQRAMNPDRNPLYNSLGPEPLIQIARYVGQQYAHEFPRLNGGPEDVARYYQLGRRMLAEVLADNFNLEDA